MFTPETVDAVETCAVCDDVLTRPEARCAFDRSPRVVMLVCGTCGTRQVAPNDRHDGYFDVAMRLRPGRRRSARAAFPAALRAH